MASASLVHAEPRRLGDLPPVGPIGYGQMRVPTDDRSGARALLEAALDAGMNLVDTADVYGLDADGGGFGAVEEVLGAVLAEAPQLRDRLVLATKGGIRPPVPYDSSPTSLRVACEASLRRLRVESIDLYQIHRPDMFTHPADVAATLSALRDEGKIREVGVSNHTPAQVEALRAHLPFPIVSNQPEYSAVHLDPLRDGTLDVCMHHGITPIAWSPLAGGRLATGEGVRPELLAVIDAVAVREDTDRATVALAFVLAHPSAPIAIVGTQRPERVVASTAALGITIDRSDVYAIVQASEGVALP
ncbi:MAG: aldo/keto reductase [Ilumatobacteraceae bacterium]